MGSVNGARPDRRGVLDAGWLFVLAGLAACGAALLIPAQQDLAAVEVKRDQLQAHSMASTRQLAAYDSVLQGLADQDPVLLRRLAANQLNLLPEGEVPVLLDPEGADGSVDQWVLESTRIEAAPDPVVRETLLARLSSGPYRLLVIAAGILCLFIGTLYPGAGEISSKGRTA